MDLDKENEEVLDKINKLEKSLNDIDEGVLHLSVDMFENKDDFYLTVEDIKKYIKSEIVTLENKLKEYLYKKVKEE